MMMVSISADHRGGRRGRQSAFTIQFCCMSLLQCLQEIEKLNFEPDGWQQTYHHRIAEFEQSGSIDVIV